MMPPAYVKPYVKRNKTDVADAEAICEAVIRLGCSRFCDCTRFCGLDRAHTEGTVERRKRKARRDIKAWKSATTDALDRWCDLYHHAC